jgi:hypothetical protein
MLDVGRPIGFAKNRRVAMKKDLEGMASVRQVRDWSKQR